jgi:2-polyprenyl-6-methoxyphenol hydroxylase-like FAD-dependent oxidoreductase
VDEAPEIVIVGGGIAGGALATVLARAGLSVVVFEPELKLATKRRKSSAIATYVVEAQS